MRRSRFVVQRLGTLGVVALVAGAVLLGTGVAVSAQPSSKAAVAAPNKKKPTTTTSTSTTMPPAPTTTQPCTGPATATATGVNTSVTPNTTATLTMSPGSCIVGGTVVTISGSGFQDTSAGTFLECNSDPNQPVMTNYPIPNADIPISCTSPFAGPGVKVTSSSGNIGPVSFTILTALDGVGPPCGPSACTGASASTDSSGGNPFTDAAQYPCPPTAAQMAAGDTCGIIFGDSNGDGVTIPISFNLNVAPPQTAPVVATSSTVAATTTTVKPASKAKTTKAATSALAFTGTGPGLWWLALVGMTLIFLGLLALALVDQPRRLLRVVHDRVSRPGPGSP